MLSLFAYCRIRWWLITTTLSCVPAMRLPAEGCCSWPRKIGLLNALWMKVLCNMSLKQSQLSASATMLSLLETISSSSQSLNTHQQRRVECQRHCLSAMLSTFQAYSSHWILSTEWLGIVVYTAWSLHSIDVSSLYHLQHEAICQFPSDHFYNGCLKADKSLEDRKTPGRSMEWFWPQGEKLPIVFCNVVGREEESSGSEIDKRKIDPRSKCNKQEAEKVVSIDHHFVQFVL